jgi:large subunit ribosomal protein L3
MESLKAKKINMTQIFAENGRVEPVTVLVVDGDEVALSEGDVVTVRGTSKGKGFQGVVKRHGFKGGRRSHGQKHSEREPGSIGGGGRAGGRVARGMRMAGRMGGDTVTVQNLTVIKLIADTKEVFLRGAVPGRRGSKVEIRKK